MQQWLEQVDAVTVEFENVPAECMRLAESRNIARPSARVLRVAQHRRLEKQSLADAGLAVTPFHAVEQSSDLEQAEQKLGLPLVLKTARCGYDGKGQKLCRDRAALVAAFAALGGQDLVAEQWIELEREISVLVARGKDGQIVVYPPVENVHVNHILDVSTCPARDEAALLETVRNIAQRTAECLDLVGLLCIEMFCTRDGQVLINEIAPRPTTAVI